MVDSVTDPARRTHHLRFRTPEGLNHVLLRRGHASPATQAPERSLASGTWTSSFAINLVHAGSGTYIDDRGQQHAIAPGCAFFRLPDRPHETRIDAVDYDETWLLVSRHAYLHLRSLSVIDTQQPVVQVRDPRAVAASIDTIHAIPQRRGDYGPAAWVRFLHLFLGLMAELRHDAPPAPRAPPWIIQAKYLLGSNLARDLPLDELAARLGLSTQRFRKSFKEHVGMAPMAYRIHMRVDRARSELMLASVAEVARTLGFGDPKHFSRQFRRHTGLSPRAYQRLGREHLARIHGWDT